MNRPRSLAVRLLTLVAAVVLVSGCVPPGPTRSTPSAEDLVPVFALVTPESQARVWAEHAAELLTRTEAALERPAAGASRGTSRVAPGLGTSVADTRELGEVRGLSDASVEIENGVLNSYLLFGVEAINGAPPQGFRHESRTRISVCPPEGSEFVTGRWDVLHEQNIVATDGTVTRLDITISATLTATSAGGETFDATGIHLHIRRTDTAPDGRSGMWQGSVETSLTGLTDAEWSHRVADAVGDPDLRIHTRDEWVRTEGFGYLLTGAMSVEVPRMVAQAQHEADRGVACGGWSVVPVELTNTFLNPLGNVPEVRRWSGYVCGDPFTTPWHFAEDAVTFRGPEVDEQHIVPLYGDAPFEGLGVMPRLEPLDDVPPGAAPFRLSFEERWPEGAREVSHQRVYAEVVPAGELCAP